MNDQHLADEEDPARTAAHVLLGAGRGAWAFVGICLAFAIVASGFAVIGEVLFSLCSFIVLRAFDQSVGYADVVIVNVAVALFAGLVPVPGGMGVTEAALAAGYIAIGVDEATAISAALCYRLITFYTPPLFGARAFHSLQRQHFL